jgi:hypothetical protein
VEEVLPEKADGHFQRITGSKGRLNLHHGLKNGTSAI